MKIEKVEKFVANLHDKTEYVIHIRNLKQAFNHGLVLKKVHRIIKFNQNAWLRPCIDVNADLWKKSKNNFEKEIRTKLSYYKVFYRKFASNINEKNVDSYE